MCLFCEEGLTDSLELFLGELDSILIIGDGDVLDHLSDFGFGVDEQQNQGKDVSLYGKVEFDDELFGDWEEGAALLFEQVVLVVLEFALLL